VSRLTFRAQLGQVPLWAWPIVALVAIFFLLLLGWNVDSLAQSSDQTGRGVAISGEDVGGMTHEEVAVVVDDLAEGFGDEPVEIVTPAGTIETSPSQLGLTIDTAATVDAAFEVKNDGFILFRPFRWFASFFIERPSRVEFAVSPARLGAALASEPLALNTPATAPKLAVEVEELVVVPGIPGEGVDTEALVAALPEAAGRSERPIRVEVGWAEVPPPFTDEEADALLQDVQRANERTIPTTVRGIALDLPGEELGLAWRSSDGGSQLVLELEETEALDVLEQFVADRTDIASQGARFEVVSGEVQIVLPEESEVCCDPSAVAAVQEALLADQAPTEPVDLPLRDADDEQARAELEELGINELVASFTTNHACCQNRVENIHRIADITRGVVIRPGATFSVNNYVGRRTEENGFVSDGVIQDGVFEEQVGGGISQYATTLFNSAFRAGLDFGEYQSHSLYISRYPYGVEATLSFPHPDLQIINTTRYGILLWPSYTGSSITVNLYSTKHIEVEQTGQTESPQDQCTRVTTTRKRTYDDGTVKDDSVFAVYRPGEGLRCDGSSTVTTTTAPPPPPSTEPTPTTTEAPPPATTEAPPPATTEPPPPATTTTTVTP
jgi:vancomycin resistance protein YoaR